VLRNFIHIDVHILNNMLSYQFILCNLQDFSSGYKEYGRGMPFVDGMSVLTLHATTC
jgi:hypothetical protein